MNNYDKWLQSGADAGENEQESVDKRVAELMKTEYQPFTPEHIVTALCNDCLFLNDGEHTISDYAEQGNYYALGLFVKVRIYEYWERQANSHAHEDWQNGYRD
jgi:hypothetical protein